MKTHALQRQSHPSDYLVAHLQTRSSDDQASAQPLPPGVDFSHVDLFSHAPQRGAVQAKLTVGAPNDQYEQEADRVAEQVVSTPDSAVQSSIQREAAPEEELQMKPLAATITPLVQRSDSDSDDEDLQAKSLGNTLQRESAPEEEEELQMKPSLQRASDGTAPAGDTLENQLNSSKNSGNPLPNDIRTFMEPRFGADFSQVRVHTGSAAVQMNRDLSAQAFTHGNNIYFGNGKAPAKDELTAHELTHVVQQTGSQIAPKLQSPASSSEVGRSSILAPRETAEVISRQSASPSDIQRDVVETYGGAFETKTYEDASTADGAGFITRPSAEIELEFRANELVNCPKFGITQTTNAQVEGAPSPVRAEVTGRSTTAADHGEEGRYLDRAGQRTNPMYGVDNQAPGVANPQLGGGANAANSRWGHRTVQPDGSIDETEAYLYDKPARNRAVTDPVANKGQSISHQFEATALCVEGNLSGTYLGSVRWGYQVDADNNFSLTPFGVVSMGAPTQQFMAAAELWNGATVDMGGGVSGDTIDLPVTSHQTVDPASLDDEQLFRRIRELADEIMAMERDDRLKLTPDYQNKRFEARGLARTASQRGAVAEDSGKTYTVKSGDTLWNIASTHLGGGLKWTHIFALNVVNVLDPNLILPGQQLKMPKPYAG